MEKQSVSNSLFEDLKTGLEQAIDISNEKGSGKKTTVKIIDVDNHTIKILFPDGEEKIINVNPEDAGGWYGKLFDSDVDW